MTKHDVAQAKLIQVIIGKNRFSCLAFTTFAIFLVYLFFNYDSSFLHDVGVMFFSVLDFQSFSVKHFLFFFLL